MHAHVLEHARTRAATQVRAAARGRSYASLCRCAHQHMRARVVCTQETGLRTQTQGQRCALPPDSCRSHGCTLDTVAEWGTTAATEAAVNRQIDQHRHIALANFAQPVFPRAAACT
eukprot:6180197-Pleurochrysis_carterae.AAC.1